MLDIALIRNSPDLIREGIRKKRMKVDIEELLQVDETIRELREKRSASEPIATDSPTRSRASRAREKTRAWLRSRPSRSAWGTWSPN